MIAVIATGGKQYLVKPGDTLKVEKLVADKDSSFVFDQVLLTVNEDGSNLSIGSPYIDGAKITATVLDQARHDKIMVVKYKRKVRYKKTHGHRQHFTKVKIETV